VSDPPLLRVEGLSKDFGADPVLRDVTLAVRRGERFALLGASGSGKTTLLRLIAGLDVPSGGRIILDGDDITDLPAYRRPVNMVFQSYALFPHLTVRRNVAFGLEQDGVGAADVERRVAEVLELVQLTDLVHRRPAQLSGGQAQRVALARALVKRPKLLLLDEPMAALDRQLRERTRLELARLQRQLGIAFILVTHDQDEAMSLSDRVAVMQHGRIVQVGTPDDVYGRPTSRFVAAFVGQVNLVEGRVRSIDAGDIVVDGQGLDRPIRIARRDSGEALAAGQSVTVVLRPESIATLAEEPGDGINSCRAILVDRMFFGDQSLMHFRLASGVELKALSPNLGAPRAAIGDAVWLRWGPEAGVVLTQ
jgi:putrescine transport system ATP-binding protein